MNDEPDFTSKGPRLCMTVADPDIFFGEMENPRTELAKTQVSEAKAVCHDCPYIYECALYALRHKNEPTLRGVWGGLSESDRRNMRVPVTNR